MNDINTTEFKTRLETEKAELEKTLAEHGRIIAADGDWAAAPPEPEESEEDYTVQADRMEEFQINVGTLSELEARHAEVVAALARIEEGTYGICSVSGNPIEKERLEANPAATTCIEYMDAK